MSTDKEPTVKRVGLTLPIGLYERVEQWATQEGRAVANLVTFVLEKAVDDAIEEGRFVPQSDRQRFNELLSKLLNGELKNGDLAHFAHDLDLSEEILTKLRDKLNSTNKGGRRSGTKQ